ncbi:F-type H+-transporting ATPase subunit epsilon [Thermosulfidibacter takaii ABI70S6]|uniref:ATP synthase epsilon chain n=1 Tax=Thermosulfidibacter takaii (strain DSM 17441 / JCM 13301 / NBRC 103674 / ABI70S6) TaxID=1298851 RepID=A0A0S3QTL4_THET7|nr:ATP synthase F1 subunit epsilon [Thermosulfidibacter takaii]BAT71667.1 F-type H+-transporting ATPase subunit epsilon [Thermosulfidibacter takaii ABI70S6]
MSGKLMLEIATPEKLVFSGEVDYVTAPGGLGEFTVLPKHTPLLTTISPGILKFSTGGSVKEYAVGWGYAEVRPYKVLVLIEFAVTKDEIDTSQLTKELEEAQAKAYDSTLSEEERAAYQKQMERLKAKKKLIA